MLQTNILFVDETNNGRSIFAEAHFNRGAGGATRAFSAGLDPAEVLDRHVIDVLREEGVNAEDYCPKPVDIFMQPYSPRIDLVVGFSPAVATRKMPILPNHPPFIGLKVGEQMLERHGTSRKRALRECFADIRLVIDRAKAKGRLPSSQAA